MVKAAKQLKAKPLKSENPGLQPNQIYRPMVGNSPVKVAKLPFVISFSVGIILLFLAILTSNSLIGLISVAILIVTLIIFYEKFKVRKKNRIIVERPIAKLPNKPTSRIDRLLIKNNELKKMKENIEKGMKKSL